MGKDVFGYKNYGIYTQKNRDRQRVRYVNSPEGLLTDDFLCAIFELDPESSDAEVKRALKVRILNIKRREFSGARKRLGECLDWENWQFTHGFEAAMKINALLPVGITHLVVDGGFEVTFTSKKDYPFIKVQEGLFGTPALKVRVRSDQLEPAFYDPIGDDKKTIGVEMVYDADLEFDCRIQSDEDYTFRDEHVDYEGRPERQLMTAFSLFLTQISEGITFGNIPEIRIWLKFGDAGDSDDHKKMLALMIERFTRETEFSRRVILEKGISWLGIDKISVGYLIDLLIARKLEMGIQALLLQKISKYWRQVKDEHIEKKLVDLFNSNIDPWKSLLQAYLGASFTPQIKTMNEWMFMFMEGKGDKWDPNNEYDIKEARKERRLNKRDFMIVVLADAGDHEATKKVYEGYIHDDDGITRIIDDFEFYKILKTEVILDYLEKLIQDKEWKFVAGILAYGWVLDEFKDNEELGQEPRNRNILSQCKSNASIIIEVLLEGKANYRCVKHVFYAICPESSTIYSRIVNHFLKMKEQDLFEGIDYKPSPGVKFLYQMWCDDNYTHVLLDQEVLREARDFWEKRNPAIKEAIEERMNLNRSKFIINPYLSVVNDDGEIKILVNDIVVDICKNLFMNVPSEKMEEYDIYLDDVRSIDELENRFEDKRREVPFIIEKGMISIDDEFWAHCSVLQAWAENDYDTRLLHSSIAFPLLKQLKDCSDPRAIVAYKREIVSRFLDGSVGYMLVTEDYIRDVDDGMMLEKLKEIFDSYNAQHCIYLYRELEGEELAQAFPMSAAYVRDNSNLKARSGGFDLSAHEIGFFIEKQGIHVFDEAMLEKLMILAIRRDYNFQSVAKSFKKTGKRITFTPTKSGYDLFIDFCLDHKLDADFIKQEIKTWLGDKNKYGYGSLENLIYWVKDESFGDLRDYLLGTIIQNIRGSLPMLATVPFLRPSSAFSVDADKEGYPHQLVIDSVRNRAILCFRDGSLTAWNMSSHERELAIDAPFKGECKLLISADADHAVILPHELEYPILKISLVTGEIIKRVEGQKPTEVPSPPEGVVLTAEQRDRYLDQLFKAEKEYIPPFRKWHVRSPRDNKLICVTERNELKLYDDALDCIFTKVIDLSINSLVLIGQDKIIYPIFPKEDNFAFSNILYTSTRHAIGESGTPTSVKLKESISKGDEPVVTQQGRYIIWPRSGRVVEIYDIEEQAISSITHDLRSYSSRNYAISPDDTRLFQGGMIGIFQVLLDSDLEFENAAFSADGNHLVTLSIAKTLKTWELPARSNRT
jgi:hypothetical protein